MKRVIVTGASGFIGRYTLQMLVQAGFEVHAVSRDPDPKLCEGVLWHHLDIMDDRSAGALCSSIEATHLMHLAWYTEHGKFWMLARIWIGWLAVCVCSNSSCNMVVSV